MISREVCQLVLEKAVSTGADYAEIFAENTVLRICQDLERSAGLNITVH